jgi:putative inorganic carbon (hco3(-)) transporter
VPTWRQWTHSAQVPLVAASAFLAILVGSISGIEPRLGLLAALGVIFAALVLTNLQIGFLAMVLFAYLEVLTVFNGVSLAKVAGALIVVAWIAVATTRGGAGRNLFTEHAGFTYLILAFLGWNLLSLAWSDSGPLALESVMRYALNAFLIPIAFTAVRDRRDAVHVLAAIVAGASVAAVSAILSPPAAESAVAGRATGTVGDPNELAAGLLIGLALAVAFAVNRHITAPLRRLAAAAAVLCLAGILFSLSRGGLVGVAAALVLAVVVGGRWRARAVALCGTVALLAVGYFAFFASLPAKERVLNIGGGGGTGRLDLWTVGLRMIAAHPLNGVGSGQFANSSVHYLLRPGLIESGAFILSTPKVAHNTYLNIVSELGVVGGILFLATLIFSVGCAFLAVKRAREAGDERMEILLRGLIVGIGGYLVTLMFISENYAKLFWVVLALGPVMLAVMSPPRAKYRASADRPHSLMPFPTARFGSIMWRD